MDEDVDARERLFHSVVREYIVSMRFASVKLRDSRIWVTRILFLSVF